jgi:hypothetical protein
LPARKKAVKRSKRPSRAASEIVRATPLRQPRLTHHNYDTFLKLYAEGVPPFKACEAANVSLRSITNRRQTDEEFAKRYAEADDAFTTFLEGRAQTMAAECFHDKPTMLIFMLNARRPEVYRPQIGVKGTIVHTFAQEFSNAMQNIYNGTATDITPKH